MLPSLQVLPVRPGEHVHVPGVPGDVQVPWTQLGLQTAAFKIMTVLHVCTHAATNNTHAHTYTNANALQA